MDALLLLSWCNKFTICGCNSTLRMSCFHRSRSVFHCLVDINIVYIDICVRVFFAVIFSHFFKFLLRHYFEECFEDEPRCKCYGEANAEVGEEGCLGLNYGLDTNKDEHQQRLQEFVDAKGSRL